MTDLTTTPQHGNRGDGRDRPTAPAGIAIAISRESGARGETIARRIGKRLGWQVYTQELLEFLCANEAARQSVLADVPVDAAAWVSVQLDRIRSERGFDPNAEDSEMPRLILALAARGQAVLVGRGAGYYLPSEMSLHVRIVAALADRIAHMADWSRLTREQAAEQVRLLDERRAEFLFKHFGRRTTDPHDFDLILNSGLLGEETCADIILAALNGKQDALAGDSRLG
ncbi:MAG TPA: cytidylate kinase-like family protein [Gemmataceae bacterium]|jgi:cytidylate kinase|nr:cytidylate kinase-like family protein [Gemmataceae bacterium]